MKPQFIHETLTLLQQGQISPLQLCEEALTEIEKHNASVNAFAHLDTTDHILAQAQASTKRWQARKPLSLLDGIPMTAKDSVLTQGLPSCMGSALIPPTKEWNEDAPVMARLKEAGAILLGKTTMPEFGWKGVTDNAVQGIARNPWDLSKTPGGSSGGAAIACSLGWGFFGLGTDGGGSIRIPASFCGVAGLKPTRAAVASYPPSTFGSLGHIGPLARCSEDLMIIMNIIAGYEPCDPYSMPLAKVNYQPAPLTSLKGLKIGYCFDLENLPVDPEVLSAVEKARQILTDLGATLLPVKLPVDGFLQCFAAHWYVCAKSLVDSFPPEKQALIDLGLRQLAEYANSVSLRQYVDATLNRQLITSSLNIFMQDYDALITPTMPILAFAAGVDSPHPNPSGEIDNWTPYTCLFNLTGHPALSLPCGLSQSGLPIGLQIIGDHHQDARILQIGQLFEKAYPPLFPDIPNF